MTKPIPKRKTPEKADTMGVTLLMEAAKHNAIDKILECLDAGHNIDATDNAGYTALMHGVVAGAEEAALMLMHHKAALGNTNRAGQNALHMATTKTSEDSMDQVVERWAKLQGPLDAQDKLDHHTPLMNAIAAGNIWQAVRLVDAGADFDTLADKQGYTAERQARMRFEAKDFNFFKIATDKRRADEAKRALEKREAISRAVKTLKDDVSAPAVARFRKKGVSPSP